MPYTTGERYTFQEKVLNKKGDIMQLVIVFGNPNDVVITDIDPKSVGLNDYDHGSLSWRYDLDEPFLVPSSYTFSIDDKYGYLANRLFDFTSLPDAVEYNEELVQYDGEDVVYNRSFKDAFKQLEIWLYINGILEFFGYTTEDNIEFQVGQTNLVLTAITNTDIINQQPLYDDEGNSLNPLGYSTGQWISLETLFIDIYKLMLPGMTLDWKHNWIVKTVTPGTYQLEGALKDAGINTDYYFFKTPVPPPQSTLGDLLRDFANAFGAYTGIARGEKAFFHQLFDTENTNFQEIRPLRVTTRYNYGKILYEFLKGNNNTPSITRTVTYGDVNKSGIESSVIRKENFPLYYNGNTTPIFSVEQLRLTTAPNVLDSNATITTSRDPVVQISHTYHLDHLGNYLWYHRSKIGFNRGDEFVMEGIDYDILRPFQWEGFHYQILSMNKNYSENETTIIAMVVQQ